MCGRYAASRDTATLVAEFEVTAAPQRDLAPDYNVAPTKEVYAVVDRAPGPAAPQDADVRRELAIVRWGLVPSWAKDPAIGSRMINARVETINEKPAYRRAAARRRCLLPADGYYEWYEPTEPGAPTGRGGKRLKQPFYIHPADDSVLAMAGLYEFWRDRERPAEDPSSWLWTVTIITTSATDELGRIHDRMPMCVGRDRWSEWLDPENTDGAAAVSLLTPAAPGWLAAYPVSREVNNVRNNGPELLAPLAEA